jgi:hypothetical protein
MRPCVLLVLAVSLGSSPAAAQTFSYTGFVEGRGVVFAQPAPNDPEQVVGDGLFRNELTVRPADWLRLVGGVDLRVNSHDQVEDEWRLDYQDRGILRPRLSLRRAAATLTFGRLTLDMGKQFIRWGRADVIYPTDRFAPRDYLNVIDPELLPVIAARTSLQLGSETLEGIWSPQLTPSRLPLLDERWVTLPRAAAAHDIQEAAASIPRGRQVGARWRHTGSRLETAVSFYDGYNHLPDIAPHLLSDSGAVELIPVYPRIRMYGGDLAVPTSAVLFKAEAAYVRSPSADSDDYVLYVLEIERQAGEWLIDLGYAGDAIQERRVAFSFAPDRSMARSVIGRASYSIDPRRTLVIEGAARQNGAGYFAKLEYSQALNDHWRVTLSGVGIAGDDDDFIGQYHRNSHGSVALRCSF